jgi:hypothetical protein
VDQTYIARADGIAINDDVEGPRSRIDLDAGTARSRDRHVARSAEQSSDFAHGAADVNSVKESTRSRNRDGREYAHYCEGDRELDERECGAHLSFCGDAVLGSI